MTVSNDIWSEWTIERTVEAIFDLHSMFLNCKFDVSSNFTMEFTPLVVSGK